MSKQDSSAGAGDLTRRLDVIDEALRTKYMRIVECLSINELKKFNKFTYQQMIKSDISDLIPEVSKQDVEDRSLYISNYLGNEVPKLRGRKAQTQSKLQIRRRTRSNKNEIDQTELQQNSTSNIDNENTTRNTSNPPKSQIELSDSVLKDFDHTMVDHIDSLNSTVTNSFLFKTSCRA